MALFHTTVLDNQIKALSTIGSASGSIATFETDRAENLINLEVAITATGGGGTPVSPIAINGFSACNLSVNGTTETITFGQTVYGGRLNVGSGVLTITHGYLSLKVGDMNNNESYPGWKPSGVSALIGYNKNVIVGDGKTSVGTGYGVNTYVGQDVLFLPVSAYGLTQSQWIATYPNMYVDFLIELETPTTIQLDSKQIQAIIGTNNVYSDTGDIIDLKFVLSVGKAIS